MQGRDLNDLVALWKAGSFSAAAKRRGVAVSTLARRLAALEADLRLTLLDRRADGARLTPSGEEIARLAEPMADQFARVERAADALRAGATRLPVRVSATEFVISDILAPALPQLWRMGARFPLQLRSEFDLVSLAARDADLAIRMSPPEGASLYARKLGEIPLGLFAAPAYFDGRDPAALNLADERLLIYDGGVRLPETDWFAAAGLTGAVAMATSSVRALLNAARAGAGIALLPAPLVRGEPLIEVPSPGLPSRTPWLLVHRDARRLPAVSLTRRWIAAAFARLAPTSDAAIGPPLP